MQQFLSVPREAETCGPVIHDEDGHGVRRGAAPGRGGHVRDEPHSYFPDYVAAGATAPPGAWRGPRPSIVQVWRS